MSEPDAKAPGFFNSDTAVGAGFLGVVVLLMIPISPVLLDILLALSLAASTIVFLTALFSRRPTDFSVFPTLLLVVTLMRLALNIASTRLILLHGHEGEAAAGRIISAFSAFVVGGNLGVGIIIFLALVIINFVVITKGAGRIAEVAARFTLDALPGKQMAVDAELNAGAISDAEAKAKREQIEGQADFYGAMDGASKFVRGDAIAGLIITAINIVGGIVLGVVQQDMDLGGAVASYSILSVGDGLVSQMPALVVSTAAGLVISRASGKAAVGTQFAEQLLGGRSVLLLSAAFMMVIGFVPSIPFLPFGGMAAAMILLARMNSKKEEAEAEPEETPEEQATEPGMGEVLHVDPLTLEVGYGLLSLVDPSRGGDVPERVRKLRRQVAQELGVIVPPLRVVDNLQLAPQAYSVRVYGSGTAQGELRTEQLLAIDSAGVGGFADGEETVEPVFGLRAYWVARDAQRRAEAAGLTVVDSGTVLATHLGEILRRNAEQFLDRDQVYELVEFAKAENPKLVEDVIPKILPAGDLVGVLRGLLRERVSVRNLPLILEACVQVGGKQRSVETMVEAARAALWRQITESVKGEDGVVRAICLEGALEHNLRNSVAPTGELVPEPTVMERLVQGLAEQARKLTEQRLSPCVLAADDLRRSIRALLEVMLPDVPVVSMKELDRQAPLEVVGTVGLQA